MTLGARLGLGQGVAKDLAAANRLFRKACDLGHAEACSNLGLSYENGWGVDEDLARAAAFYEQACTGQNASACAAGLADACARMASLAQN